MSPAAPRRMWGRPPREPALSEAEGSSQAKRDVRRHHRNSGQPRNTKGGARGLRLSFLDSIIILYHAAIGKTATFSNFIFPLPAVT